MAETFSTCDRMTRGPYERENNVLKCRDEWSTQALGTPCRTLSSGGTQKITAVPLKKQFGDLLYTSDESFNDQGLLDNVFLAPLIDPYKSAQRNLTVQESTSLARTANCPADLVSSCSPNDIDVPICLSGKPSCPLQYQKALLDCAANPSSTDPTCIGGVLGANAIPNCEKVAEENGCDAHPMFCRWDATPFLDPQTKTTVPGKCMPINPVQSCYDAVVEKHSVCQSDKRLIQYVQDARSGVLIEKAERIRAEANRVCSVSLKASATEYIRLRTKAPHGISKNGTKVLITGMGKNDGLRTVFIVDDRTLTYLRRPEDEEMPTASSIARIYIPYESSEGIVEYTRGESGRPAKKDPQCVRREAYEQCRSMPNKHKRRYVMLPTHCEVVREGCIADNGERGYIVDNQCKVGSSLHEGYRKSTCVQDVDCGTNEYCVGERVSEGNVQQGVCTIRKYETCGYERHDAGVGPDPAHGKWHFTKAETSNARKVGENTKCGFQTTALGNFGSVDACAQACAETLNCNFFMYGKGTRANECLMSETQTKECVRMEDGNRVEGLKDDTNYDMYEIVLQTNQAGCSRFGESCCPEAHMRGKENSNVKCAFQKPDDSGAFRLNLVNPGNNQSPMCIPQQVETLKDNRLLAGEAAMEAMQFDDMKNKNSHVALQFRKMQDFRDELDNGCCNDEGTACGCPYVDYPVYYAAYEDGDKVEAKPVGVNNVIAGCDNWNDVENEIVHGNKLDRVALSYMKGDSYKESCENGWLYRDCKKYKEKADALGTEDMKGSNAALRLSACQSGIQLRAMGAPIDYVRHKKLMLSRTLAKPFTNNMSSACDPTKEPGAEGYCAGTGAGTSGCSDDKEGTNRCQQCVTDENCAVALSSENYVCRPVVDPKREIIYDGTLSDNPYTRHGYSFKTCQRKDLYDSQKRRLNKQPFADYQRNAEIRMFSAQKKSTTITITMLVLLVAAGVGAYFLWPKK